MAYDCPVVSFGQVCGLMLNQSVPSSLCVQRPSICLPVCQKDWGRKELFFPFFCAGEAGWRDESSDLFCVITKEAGLLQYTCKVNNRIWSAWLCMLYLSLFRLGNSQNGISWLVLEYRSAFKNWFVRDNHYLSHWLTLLCLYICCLSSMGCAFITGLNKQLNWIPLMKNMNAYLHWQMVKLQLSYRHEALWIAIICEDDITLTFKQWKKNHKGIPFCP